MRIKAFTSDAGYRWLLTALVAAVSVIGLSRMNFTVKLSVILFAVQVSLVMYGLGLGLIFLGRVRKSSAFLAAADFFCSASQYWMFLIFAAGLQYLAAANNLPLFDEVFLRADQALGFDWDAYSSWAAQLGYAHTSLNLAYNSVYLQMIVIALAHSARHETDGNAEFIWCYMVSLLLVVAVSALAPAAGRPGMLGQQHIDVFLAAREGTVSGIDGIISFPSFHAVLGILLIYSARNIKPLLGPFVPLNVLLILATPPCGGHYLVDTFAGIATAVCAILLVRHFREPRASAAEFVEPVKA